MHESGSHTHICHKEDVMKRIALFVLCLIFAASAAYAVDLVNKDSGTYEVKIHDVGTTHSSISGNTTRTSVCSDCKIEVVGVGEVEASGSETVIIENGQLRKE